MLIHKVDEGQGGIRDWGWWTDRGNSFVTKITNSQMHPENSPRVSMFILTRHHKMGAVRTVVRASCCFSWGGPSSVCSGALPERATPRQMSCPHFKWQLAIKWLPSVSTVVMTKKAYGNELLIVFNRRSHRSGEHMERWLYAASSVGVGGI